MTKHLSDSSEQREAESHMLCELEKKLDLHFDQGARLPVSVGVQPDAIDLQNKVVVEVYARVGAVKGAQLHKIKGDVLKLALIGKELGSDWRKIMCFASDSAAGYVQGKSWVAEAAKVFGIEIHVVALSSELQAKVMAAQTRQKMVNPT
ncbi:hypothetical protein [Alkalimonas amylolytica]|uniref:Uncharacterized protein n=1 Tax=Alkalimonas amylolytica TaxID=152573 RepID=A0A1H4FMD3_ALKAM|nr:hypothetical protein [Alkalimonas amylolytica]SEA98464.1 hypothetical protein SAMN04488051_11184 [Alkalimonas amylolytica]